MIPVHFKRQWEDLHADPSRTTSMLYPRGWVGEVTPERAAYLLAVGYAAVVDEAPADLQAAVDELVQVVALLRERNVEPTIAAVYMTYNDILQAQQAGQGQPAAADSGETAKPARKKAAA